MNHRSLKLEITESMVMDDVEEAIAILDKLKQLDSKPLAKDNAEELLNKKRYY